ncbi:carbon-nitrogen hydrolase family protein [Alcanivorax sp. S6407]|uniref:carbon-nitrogen hydrolase family protein n=1 Tax=Alcanivorax sp. S6407 TaxID=2926424 RepID=UPI001FF4F1E1|nr:carbon-nitrogen hydrolase family protein [Alcanivorax sp. S6407]MCK0154974.1 carbon-nitrogen hydrolase family protein [Alcanivorax sp. S6407]
MTQSVKIAAIQMTSSNDVQANLDMARRALQKAAGQDAALAVLPENFAQYGGDYRGLSAQYVWLKEWLCEQARTLGMAIIGGSIPAGERPDGSPVPAPRVRTRCLAIDEKGRVQGSYDKLHLFDAQVNDAQGRYCESDVFEPGEATRVVTLAGLKVGLAICYDLRFPALAQRLASDGADLLVYPSAFTAVTGAAHWELLMRATALQSGCYTLGANQCGQHAPRRASYGHSLLANPWGEVEATLGDSPDVLVATLDLATMKDIRQRIPVQQHQRLTIKGP